MPQSYERWLQKLSDMALNNMIRNVIQLPNECGECSAEFTHPMDLAARYVEVLPYDPAYFATDSPYVQDQWLKYAKDHGGVLLFCKVIDRGMHHCYQKWLSRHQGAGAYITKRGLERMKTYEGK